MFYLKHSLQLSDPCELPGAAPGSRRAVIAADARVPAALVAAACGPSLGGAIVRAGWIARQALVQRGEEAGRA